MTRTMPREEILRRSDDGLRERVDGALKQAQVDRRPIAHAVVPFFRQDYWTPAAHVAALALGDTRATTFEVRRASNAGLLALQTAALRCERSRPSEAVVVSAADVFNRPHIGGGLVRFRDRVQLGSRHCRDQRVRYRA